MSEDLFDTMGLEEEAPAKPYVPRFEKDLAKAGNLEALSAQKQSESSPAAETKKSESADETKEDAFVFEQPEKPEPPVVNAETEADLDIGFDFTDTYDDEKIPDAASIVLDEMDVPKPKKPVLSEMTTDKKAAASSLKKQMLMDDLSMAMAETAKPELEELSNEYGSSKQRAEDLTTKDKLERDEKQMLKDRLNQEISAKSKGYNAKASASMYKSLMAEKKIKTAKKGSSYAVLMVILGLIDAAVIMFMLNWNESNLFQYLAVGTAVFALAIMFKSKPAKTLTTLFFGVDTICLIGFGLIKYVLDNPVKPENYMEMMIFFIVAIVLSGFICFMLATNTYIDAYTTTNIKKEKKIIEDEANAKAKTAKRKIKR